MTLRTSGRITRSTIAVAGVGSIVATIAVLHAGTTDGRDADTTIKAPVADGGGMIEAAGFSAQPRAPLLLSAKTVSIAAGGDFSWNMTIAAGIRGLGPRFDGACCIHLKAGQDVNIAW